MLLCLRIANCEKQLNGGNNFGTGGSPVANRFRSRVPFSSFARPPDRLPAHQPSYLDDAELRTTQLKKPVHQCVGGGDVGDPGSTPSRLRRVWPLVPRVDAAPHSLYVRGPRDPNLFSSRQDELKLSVDDCPRRKKGVRTRRRLSALQARVRDFSGQVRRGDDTRSLPARIGARNRWETRQTQKHTKKHTSGSRDFS